MNCTELEKAQARIKELEEKAEEWPVPSQAYWWVDSQGDVHIDNWQNGPNEIKRLKQGNCFRTRAEAEHKRDRDAVMAKLRKAANGYEFTVGKINYWKYWDAGVKKFYPRGSEHVYHPGTVYFETAAERDAAYASLTEEE